MASTRVKVGGASAAVLLLAGALLSRWEGATYSVYIDPVGNPTVCTGHMLPKNADLKRRYTKAECDALLREDMQIAARTVQRCVGRDMPEGVYASLISLTFNVGPRPVCSGSPGKFARAGDWPSTCKSLDLYKFAGGRVFRGLVLRRADERAVCMKGLK